MADERVHFQILQSTDRGRVLLIELRRRSKYSLMVGPELVVRITGYGSHDSARALRKHLTGLLDAIAPGEWREHFSIELRK